MASFWEVIHWPWSDCYKDTKESQSCWYHDQFFSFWNHIIETDTEKPEPKGNNKISIDRNIVLIDPEINSVKEHKYLWEYDVGKGSAEFLEGFIFLCKCIGKYVADICKDWKSYHHPADFSLWPIWEIEEHFYSICVKNKKVDADKWDGDKFHEKVKKSACFVFFSFTCMWNLAQSEEWCCNKKTQNSPVAENLVSDVLLDIKKGKYGSDPYKPKKCKKSSKYRWHKKYTCHRVKVWAIFWFCRWFFLKIAGFCSYKDKTQDSYKWEKEKNNSIITLKIIHSAVK